MVLCLAASNYRLPGTILVLTTLKLVLCPTQVMPFYVHLLGVWPHFRLSLVP